MNIMEIGQTVWDIIGDIAAFIEVAKNEQSAPFTGICCSRSHANAEFCSQHVVKNFTGIVEADLHSQLHKNAITKIIQELSMEVIPPSPLTFRQKKPDDNKPASRPPNLTGRVDEEA